MSKNLFKKVLLAIAESYKAFSITSSPKLIMTLLVKDEEDILEENMLFHKSMGVDAFIVTDNNSTDRSPEIIEKYKKQAWVLECINEKGTNYNQKEWVDRMIWKAKTVYHADWVINADADELWYTPSGNLKKELSHTRANVLKCELKSVYPEQNKPFRSWTKVVRCIDNPEKYDLSKYSIFNKQRNKVLHRAAGYVQIAMGNHKVAMFPRRNAKSNILVYHYNIRGKEAFLKKMMNGGKQYEQHSGKHGGRHWRYFYELYKQGKLEQEYDRVIGSPDYDLLVREGYIQEDQTIARLFDKIKQEK